MKTKIGSIIERERKDGSISYQAMVKNPGSKAAVSTFNDREGAEKFLDAIRVQKEKNEKIIWQRQRFSPSPEQSPGELAEAAQKAWENEWLRDVLKLYMNSERICPKHKREMNAAIRLGGDVKIRELDRKWVRAYIAKARKTKTRKKTVYAWSTISGHMKIISAAMTWRAEELDARGAKLPFNVKMLPSDWEVKRTRRLSAEEERRLLFRFRTSGKPSSRHWSRMFRMALNTAARLQELRLAEWSEFNLERRFWVIPAQHTKTKVERVVPLNNAAIRALRAMKLIRSPKSERVFHAINSSYAVSNVFGVIVKKMGIVDLVWHDLRHEAISRMVLTQRNKTVFELMEIVGHSSIEMLKRYTNLRGYEVAANWIG